MPDPTSDVWWDAFASDDEMEDPDPEPGDFWGRLDDEEALP